MLTNRLFFLCAFLMLCAVYDGYSSDVKSNSSKHGVDRCFPFTRDVQGWSRGCGCRYNKSGSVVTLYSLQTNDSIAGHPKQARFQTKDKTGWMYSFNPCTDFSKFENKSEPVGAKICKNVAGARWTSESVDECYGFGSQSSAVFSYWPKEKLDKMTVSNLTLTFRNVTSSYTMQISLVCNRKIMANETTFEYLGQNDKSSTSFFKLEGICSCPNGCGAGGDHDDNEISEELWYVIGIGGGIVLALLLGVLIMYIMQRRSRKEDTSSTYDDIDPIVPDIT